MSLACSAPWSGLFVWNTGEVSYCGRTAATGNLRLQSFREFWNSPPVQQVRSLFREERYIESGCQSTCCWLTATRPHEFVKYFDIETRCGAVALSLANAVSSPFRPPRSALQNRQTLENEIDGGFTSVASFPTTMSLQVTNYCSLRCPMCCFGTIRPEDKKPSMKIIDDIVLERIKEVYPFISRLDLLGGELFDIPFDRNPLVRILADVAETAAENIAITITTNGQHLTEQWADYLIRFPFIDTIAFSVDSFDPAVYARTRVMGSLDRVRRSIANMQEARSRKGGPGPIIHLNSILGVHTHAGVSEFLHNAEMLGVDEVNFQKLVVMGDRSFFAENNLFQPHHADKLAHVWGQLANSDFRSNRASIIGQIEAYIDHLGMTDKVLADHSDIPFTANYPDGLGQYVGPLWRREVVQTFTAKRISISKIKLLFATYQRHNTCNIDIRIEDESGTVIAQADLNAEPLVDNGWRIVDLPSTRLELRRRYNVVIGSPDATEDNAVTLGCIADPETPSGANQAPPARIGCMLF